MADVKQVKDMMVPVFDYPHVTGEASVKDAMAEIKKSTDNTGGRVRFRSVLVMDGDGKLVGVLSIKDILRAVEPGFVHVKPAGYQGYSTDSDGGLVEMMKDMFTGKCREQAGRKIKDVVTQAPATVAPGDSVAKAVYLMLSRDATMLPVMESGKVVGAVRLIDVFQEVRDIVLNGQ